MNCFNPRTPCGVRHLTGTDFTGANLFQSTHSLRSATRNEFVTVMALPVSIHALLAECDTSPAFPERRWNGFNPRTPCGVRPFPRYAGTRMAQVSIHALLAECDCIKYCMCIITKTFQSTHSLRSATFDQPFTSAAFLVSIHALLAECDGLAVVAVKIGDCFNPRTPCGVRPGGSSHGSRSCGFQSTHSLRSATKTPVLGGDGLIVSIHALLAECDLNHQRGQPPQQCFNPRTPCGVRPG